jgi:arsenate reductase-like glutaredoxin family protein
MNIQIFGIKKDRDTRKAQRFFSERRIQFHFVDLKERPASKGELRRFVDRFGGEKLLNRGATRFRDLGLHVAHMSAERMATLIEDEPMLLRMPLVRNGNQLTVGLAETTWKEWTG